MSSPRYIWWGYVKAASARRSAARIDINGELDEYAKDKGAE